LCLKTAGVRRVFVGGLTTDYCVLNTVREALALGYGVVLLTDAVRAVDVAPGDGERALAEMRQLGTQFSTSADLQP
jgi:nicotinamidase/pyrazinamidase